MKEKLGKLEREVDLRKVWKIENKHFTPWLAREENLKLLADAIKMDDLKFEAKEVSVGRFRADILCKNYADDSRVLIENQLATTNHDHFGKVLAYAAGLQATTIIWVASEFTDEHRAALGWLNEITDENFYFFGLEIELWRISNSPLAPKFNVVVQPNNWSKLIAQTTKPNEQLRYWQQFCERLQEQGSKLSLESPPRRNWIGYYIDLSSKQCRIAATRDTRKNQIGVELYMWGTKKENFFHQLEKDKIAINKEIGSKLNWEPPKKIALTKDADPADENAWQEQHDWLKGHMENFVQVFTPRVSKFEPEQWNTDGEAV